MMLNGIKQREGEKVIFSLFSASEPETTTADSDAPPAQELPSWKTWGNNRFHEPSDLEASTRPGKPSSGGSGRPDITARRLAACSSSSESHPMQQWAELEEPGLLA